MPPGFCAVAGPAISPIANRPPTAEIAPVRVIALPPSMCLPVSIAYRRRIGAIRLRAIDAEPPFRHLLHGKRFPIEAGLQRRCRMSVQGMNHFTVLSDDLDVTRKFYCDLLGFEVGDRPNFQFPGYWLWVGDQPILHVIHRNQLHEHRAGVIDHMAFTATDLPGTAAKLDKAGVTWEVRRP